MHAYLPRRLATIYVVCRPIHININPSHISFCFLSFSFPSQSVESDGFALAARNGFAYRGASEARATESNVRLSRGLLSPRTLELNATLLDSGGEHSHGANTSAADGKSVVALRCHTFARFTENEQADFLTTMHKFRFFFPNYGGFMRASADRDKVS
jgi:hypothetical protein